MTERNPLPLHLQQLVAPLDAEIARLEAENHNLCATVQRQHEKIVRLDAVVTAAEPLFADIRDTVAGWSRDPTWGRHPDKLGWTPSKSRCGVAYAVSDALRAMEGI